MSKSYFQQSVGHVSEQGVIEYGEYCNIGTLDMDDIVTLDINDSGTAGH